MAGRAISKKTEKRLPTYKGQPIKAVVNAPMGPDGSRVKICEICNGEVTYFIPEEVRIAYMNSLLERAAEMLSKM